MALLFWPVVNCASVCLCVIVCVYYLGLLGVHAKSSQFRAGG